MPLALSGIAGSTWLSVQGSCSGSRKKRREIGVQKWHTEAKEERREVQRQPGRFQLAFASADSESAPETRPVSPTQCPETPWQAQRK